MPGVQNHHNDEVYRSAQSLVKFNNGVFKSTKQRDFLIKAFLKHEGSFFGAQYAGVTPDNEEKTVLFSWWVSFADYGYRSKRQVGKLFLYDKYGITQVYKLGWVCPARGSSYLDPEKTKLEWERPEVDASHLDVVEEVKEEVKTSEWQGTVGDKIDVTAKVVLKRDFFSRFGSGLMYKLKDQDQNEYTWFTQHLLEDGATYRIVGRVKEHSEYQGRKSTVLTRCKYDLVELE